MTKREINKVYVGNDCGDLEVSGLPVPQTPREARELEDYIFGEIVAAGLRPDDYHLKMNPDESEPDITIACRLKNKPKIDKLAEKLKKEIDKSGDSVEIKEKNKPDPEPEVIE